MRERSILVVDDEPMILEALCRELAFWRDRKGWNLYTAGSARKALDLLEQNHDSIQVLVSDLKMASVDGDELIRIAKRLYPNIRCILTTGHPDLDGISRAISAGITGFIPKPWEVERFIGEIEKAIAEYDSDMLERERVDRLVSQMESAAQIQKRLFGNSFFPHARYDIEVTYQPLRDYSWGGDFFHVSPISEDRCIVIIGDVTGHGPGAAFVTGMVRALISREDVAGQGATFSPSAFLGRLNRLFIKELSLAPEFYVTLTAASLDCTVHRVVFSSAGSLPFFFVRSADCTTHVLPGFPCGFAPDAQYAELSLQTRRGDKIAFMTDGLLKRGRNDSDVDLNTVRGLMTHFYADPSFNDRMIGIITEMCPDRAFDDDVTFLTIDVV